MRRSMVAVGEDPPIVVDEEQRRWARAGKKAMIPFHGFPFLAHVLSALADGGIRRVVVVVGPDPDPVRSFLEGLAPGRLELALATQSHPQGGAHALLQARDAVADTPFLLVNGDNHYPPEAIAQGLALSGAGLVAFRASSLVRHGNIPRERMAAFAVVRRQSDGCLSEMVEKPAVTEFASYGPDPLVSMTCWRFPPTAFEEIPTLPLSPRGELEIPTLALRLVESGVCVEVVEGEGGVLDLTGAEDIPSVESALAGHPVWL